MTSTVIRDELDWEESEGGMELRLTYEGELRAANSSRDQKWARKEDKHRIRQAFHKQLRRFYEATPFLRDGTHSGRGFHTGFAISLPKYDREDIANQHLMYGFRFLPLVTSQLRLSGWIDVLSCGDRGAMMLGS